MGIVGQPLSFHDKNARPIFFPRIAVEWDCLIPESILRIQCLITDSMATDRLPFLHNPTDSRYEVRAKGKYRFPPGLDHNLIFYAFRKFRPQDPIYLFEHLVKEYGPVAHYRIGPEHIVFLNDPELIREVLVVQHANFIKERTQQRARNLLLGDGMITADGPQVLEFNCRFGDPETQAILPRMKSDLLPLLEATIDGKIDTCAIEWDQQSAVTVVLASGGVSGKIRNRQTDFGN